MSHPLDPAYLQLYTLNRHNRQPQALKTHISNKIFNKKQDYKQERQEQKASQVAVHFPIPDTAFHSHLVLVR